LLKLPVDEPEKERLPTVEVTVPTVVAPELNVIVVALAVIESMASVAELLTLRVAYLLEQVPEVGQLFEQSVGSG
jgi:hypothetical protein